MKKIKFRADITAVTVVIFIVCIVLVSVMLMQFRTVEQTDITEIESMRESELRTALAEWKTKYEEVSSQLNDINARIDEYNTTINDNKETSKLIDEELSESNILVGKTNVYGEGVVLTLANNNEQQIEAYDLIDLVNELRYAGAEAISINEQRVLNMTEIVDMGDYSYITVNSKRIQEPYIVKAIGDKNYISSVLNLKGSGFVDRSKALGMNISLKTEGKVEIPKFNGEFKIKYIKEVKN